jgi:thiamine-monophosphate kinase
MAGFRESDLLSRLMAMTSTAPHVIEGVIEQDDAAVIALPPDSELCATTDFVRGTGFRLYELGHLTLRELGRYVVAANVSDLAAMGAAPLAYLSVIRYEPGRTLAEVEQLAAGIASACEEFCCPVVGGDSGSYSRDVLSGTALGILPRGRRLSRHTLRDGDVMFVSGKIGGAGAALAAATRGAHLLQPDAFAAALSRWRAPTPRLALGRALVDLPIRVSCMDVSDGLTASLQQLSKITGLGFSIDAETLPIDPCVIDLADVLGHDPVHLACSASVDFELLLACDPAEAPAVEGAGRYSGTPVTRIGRCEGGGLIRMLRADGTQYSQTPGVPWDHQSDDLVRFFDAKA